MLRIFALGVPPVTADYRIFPTPDGRFKVTNLHNEHAGTFLTQKEAEERVTRCTLDPAMWESAKLLIHTAIGAQMELHSVSHDIALYWVKSAAEIEQ